MTIAEIARRQMQKIKDHKGSASVTGAQMVETFACTDGGAETFVFDDAAGYFSDILVHCNEAGTIFHGTISVSGISGSLTIINSGSNYIDIGAATLTIDLSITSATGVFDPTVFQGAINLSSETHGPMVSGAPGSPTYIKAHMDGMSLLISNGPVTEKLSDFSFTTEDDDPFTLGGTTVDNNFTYANNVMGGIGGSITFTTVTKFHTNVNKLHPHVGVAHITGLGMTSLHITVLGEESIALPLPVQIDFTNSSGVTVTNFYSWAGLGL